MKTLTAVGKFPLPAGHPTIDFQEDVGPPPVFLDPSLGRACNCRGRAHSEKSAMDSWNRRFSDRAIFAAIGFTRDGRPSSCRELTDPALGVQQSDQGGLSAPEGARNDVKIAGHPYPDSV